MAAAAAVAHPVQRVVDSALASLNCTDSFREKISVQIPNAKAKPKATDYIFPLQSKAFMNLNVYLVLGIKLPEDAAAFELDYPRTVLEPWTTKKSGTFYNVYVFQASFMSHVASK